MRERRDWAEVARPRAAAVMILLLMVLCALVLVGFDEARATVMRVADAKVDAYSAAMGGVRPDEIVDGRWVIGTSSAACAARVRYGLSRSGIAVDNRIHSNGAMEIRVSAKTSRHYINEIAALDGVDYVEPVTMVQADYTPSDPYYAQQWGLPKIGTPAAWDTSKGLPSVTIAVVDTGVMLSHRDLSGRVDTVNDYDFVNDDTVASDDNGHGTHAAGIAAAAANSSYGIGVAPNCTILPVKVLDASGSGFSVDVADGINWAADHGADVINLSLGGYSYSLTIASAVSYAQSKGAVVVAAAGNGGLYGVIYPAAYPGVIGVGATDSSDVRAPFSNYGPEVDLVAPGVNIVSTSYTGGMTTLSGTSMAAPFVSGAAALIRSVAPSYSWSQVSSLLMSTAADKGSSGRDDYYGYGRLNVAGALAAVGGGGGGSTDDNIPGVAAPSSPVAGTLSSSDEADVYRVSLNAGELFSATLSVPTGCDFDLSLFGPTAANIYVDSYLVGSSGTTSIEQISWTAASSGTYYLVAHNYSGYSGSYSLTYGTSGGTRPNLVCTAISLPDPVDSGVQVAVSNTVQNQGAGSAGASRTDFYLSPDPTITTGDRYLGARTVSSLSAGESSTASTNLLLPQGISGTYYIGAIVDAGSAVSESNESDNISTSSAFVISVPPVQSPTLSIDINPSSPVAGDWLSVTGTLLNSVGTPIGGRLIQLQRSSSSGAGQWATIADAVTDPSGNTYMSTSAYADSSYYRLYFAGTENIYYPVFSQQVFVSPTARSTSLRLTTSSNASLGYGYAFAVKGTLKSGGVGLSGRQVILESKSTAAGASYKAISSQVTGAAGTFSFTQKPVSKTYYRVRFAGSTGYAASGPTSSVYATPKVYLRTPIAPSTMKKSNSYSVYGYLKPKHTAGTYPVRIYKWRYVSGKWKSYGYVNAKAYNYSTYTKYSRSLRLAYAGKWRVRAYAPADNGHAATWSSGYDYVTVK